MKHDTLPEIGSTNSRLASAALLAAAAAGTAFTGLFAFPLPDGASTRPLYIAAIICGALSGWLHMRRGLGEGIGRAALGGVSAAISALIYFLPVAGLRQTVRVYKFAQIDSAADLLEFLIERMIDVFWMAVSPPTLFTILIGGAVAGMLSESVRQYWD